MFKKINYLFDQIAEIMCRSFLSRLFIFSCLYWSSAAVTIAQQPISTEIFTVKEGLSENVVHCLFQDKKGFLWIGPHEGLNRFDGYSFKKYLHDKNDSTSLPNSPIEAITEDDQGHFYVSTVFRQSVMNRTTVNLL